MADIEPFALVSLMTWKKIGAIYLLKLIRKSLAWQDNVQKVARYSPILNSEDNRLSCMDDPTKLPSLDQYFTHPKRSTIQYKYSCDSKQPMGAHVWPDELQLGLS